MFGHGHSHSGGGGGHGHSHGGHTGNSTSVGFDDEDTDTTKTNPMMNQNMMMMKMMANAMKMQQAQQNSDSTDSNQRSNNMMMMSPPEMTPQMMELTKKMFEQRQQLMKEYIDKDPKSNPAILQEMMAKAAQAQAAAIAEFKTITQANTTNQIIETNNSIGNDLPIQIPGSGGSGLLNANINSSKLDELINKNSQSKKGKKEAEEAFVLDAIAKKDYSQLNAVKATQYGVLDRLKELIESNQTDPNKPDSENVSLLHWAAINNRLDIAQYLVSLGCYIDPIGGELESTPLNWAARSGHAQMLIYLMQNGADPHLFDLEGYSTIHLATMFGHSIVVAYLLAKGIDVTF